MTKQQAEQAMNEGARVTHRYFEDDEWIKMEGGKVIDEKGFGYTPEEYWSRRTEDYWQDGWELFEDKK